MCWLLSPTIPLRWAEPWPGPRAAGVPVICYDRLITGCDVDLYLSFDNVRVGRLQAEYLVARLGGKGRIVRVYGPKTDQTGLLFKQGQDEVLGSPDRPRRHHGGA